MKATTRTALARQYDHRLITTTVAGCDFHAYLICPHLPVCPETENPDAAPGHAAAIEESTP